MMTVTHEPIVLRASPHGATCITKSEAMSKTRGILIALTSKSTIARTKKLMFDVAVNPSLKKTNMFIMLARTAKERTVTVANCIMSLKSQNMAGKVMKPPEVKVTAVETSGEIVAGNLTGAVSIFKFLVYMEILLFLV